MFVYGYKTVNTAHFTEYSSSLSRSSFEGKINNRECALNPLTVCWTSTKLSFMNVAANNLFISIKKALEPIQMVYGVPLNLT